MFTLEMERLKSFKVTTLSFTFQSIDLTTESFTQDQQVVKNMSDKVKEKDLISSIRST